jgi:capsular exopolysaccharide synthesis family protein
MNSVAQLDPVGSAGVSAASRGLHDFLMILGRRKRLIISSALAVFATIALVCLGLPPRYTAFSIVMISPQSKKIVDFDSVVSGLSPDEESIQSELQVIQSRDLIWRVVQELHLDADPEFNPALRPPSWGEAIGSGVKWPVKLAASWLRTRFSGRPAIDPGDILAPADTAKTKIIDTVLSRLDVDVIGRSRAIKISFSSENPQLAADVVNKIAHDYLLQQISAEASATSEASTWIAHRLSTLGAAVEAADRKLEDFRAHSAVADGRTRDDIDDQARRLNEEYVEAQSELAQKSSELAQVEQTLKAKGIVEAGILLHSQTIDALEVQEAQLREEGAALDQKYGADYPEVQQNAAQKASIERQIAAQGGKVIANLRNDVYVLEGRVVSENQALQHLRALGAKVGEAEVNLRTLKADADAKREVQQDFLARAQQLKQGGFQPINASIVSAALPPVQPSFPKLTILLPIALVTSGAVAALMAAAAEALDRGLRNSGDVRTECGVELVALVPKVSKVARPIEKRGRQIEDDPLFAEAIGSLQVALATAPRQQGNTVLFTSAMPREGKSTIVVALARHMAVTGKRVLVIDCDFRRPRLAAYFDLPDACGLGDIASGNAVLVDTIQRDRKSGAFVVIGGSRIRSWLEHSAIARLAGELSRLQLEFDYVVLDAPPVLAVSGARLLASIAQHSIVIARWGKTSRSAISETVRLLQKAGASVTGVALSFVHKSAARHYGLHHTGYYPGARAYYNDVGKQRA